MRTTKNQQTQLSEMKEGLLPVLPQYCLNVCKICSYPRDLPLNFRHLLKKLTSPTMLDIYYRTSSEIPSHLWFWSVHNIVMLHLSLWISFDVTCMHISLHLFYPESWKSVMSIMENNLTHTETQISWCLRFFSIKKS